MLTTLIPFKTIIIWVISAIIAFLTYFRVKKSGEDSVTNNQNKETLKRVRESKKINNDIANLSDIELNQRLQKWSESE